MGKKDLLMKDYLSDPKVFADVFNYLLFHGENRIDPDKLEEVDSTERVLLKENNTDFAVQKYRDLLKRTVIRTDSSAVFVLLGIEAQSYIDYAMPVRIMLYDALQYAGQVQQSRLGSKGSSDEFLSGFLKEKHLKPVITAVVYLSPRPWDGATSLRELFCTIDGKLIHYIQDYKMLLLSPQDLSLQDLGSFSTDLGKVLALLKAFESKGTFRSLMKKEEFRLIDRKTALFLKDFLDLRAEFAREEDKVDFHNAWNEIIEDEAAKARNIALSESREETQKIAVQKMMEKLGLSMDNAMNVLDLSAAEREAVKRDLQNK